MDKGITKYTAYDDDFSPIRVAAVKFDIFIRDGGIGASLFFVLLILIGVNAHSLHFLFGDGFWSWVLSLIGGVGFSIATTAVIRKPVAKWMKFLFPIFDTMLVFLGFNMLNEAIPVHFIMTILFALFTGSILVSLGTINYNEFTKEAEDNDFKREITHLEELVKSHLSKLTTLNYEIAALRIENEALKVTAKKNESIKSNYLSEIENTQLLESKISELEQSLNVTLGEFNDYKKVTLPKLREIENLESELARKNSLIGHYEFEVSELDKYKNGYLSAEKSRILKKKQENRTAEEIELLNEFEKL